MARRGERDWSRRGIPDVVGVGGPGVGSVYVIGIVSVGGRFDPVFISGIAMDADWAAFTNAAVESGGAMTGIRSPLLDASWRGIILHVLGEHKALNLRMAFESDYLRGWLT